MGKKKTTVAPAEERVSIDTPDLSEILPPSEAERERTGIDLLDDPMLASIADLLDEDRYDSDFFPFHELPRVEEIPEQYVVAIDYGYGFDYIATKGAVRTYTVPIEYLDPWQCINEEELDELDRRLYFLLELVTQSDNPDSLVMADLEDMLDEVEDARLMLRVNTYEDDELLELVPRDRVDEEAALIAIQA